jgi:hypothetical protein
LLARTRLLNGRKVLGVRVSEGVAQ